mmetsp:Transcript_2475/g.6879  ORF Transcript_2475/g.6879 Transcript_2475/m.6879 type:complete len:176 (-) Transcript_2475:326-853(-)
MDNTTTTEASASAPAQTSATELDAKGDQAQATPTGEDAGAGTDGAAHVEEHASPDLPENRFELELEFVQSLASPAYLHFLSTSVTNEGNLLLEDANFRLFLRYLYKTWTRPEYSQYIIYPHSLYFLNMLINNETFGRELAQISFRNFCHQQQFFAWQTRFATLYGKGGAKEGGTA